MCSFQPQLIKKLDISKTHCFEMVTTHKIHKACFRPSLCVAHQAPPPSKLHAPHPLRGALLKATEFVTQQPFTVAFVCISVASLCLSVLFCCTRLESSFAQPGTPRTRACGRAKPSEWKCGRVIFECCMSHQARSMQVMPTSSRVQHLAFPVSLPP